jgi:hypothetical protein
MIMKDKEKLKAKHLSRLDISSQYPYCRIWIGTRKKNGYGVFSLNGKEYLAHRAAYIVYHGPILEGHVVHHLCENRLCITPNHIISLTPEQHVKLTAKTGAYSGEKNRNAKHSNEIVQNIKNLSEAGIPKKKLSEIFEVPYSTVCGILRGHSRSKG